MPIIKQIVLWSGVIGVCVLPALSNVGYLPTRMEYVLPALFAVILAVVCAWMARIRYVGSIMLPPLTAFSMALYFGGILPQSGGSMIIVVSAAAAGFSILSFRSFDKALVLAGTVAFAQIVGTAALTPSPTLFLKEYPVGRSNLPSVVHLMLDEHAGLAAIPADAVSPEKVREFADAYVKRGFIVFTHAYTADTLTQRSLARLFNTGQPVWKELLRRRADLQGYALLRADIIDGIAKDRALDITQVRWVDFNPILSGNPAVARNYIYNAHTAREVLDQSGMLLRDRLTLAKQLVISWLRVGIRSPIVDPNVPGRANITAFSSHFVLQRMAERLSCCGERGTYYFAHLLLPHFSYVFDAQCRTLPIRRWRGNEPRGADGIAELADRRELYRLHFGQATCASRDVFALAESLERRDAMSDTVILVHSDHGSRIVIRDYETTNPPGYGQSDAARDWRGSFIAVRIPGVEGRVIDTPVRLDKLYANLLDHDFRALDFEKLRPLEDSPY